jgi:serine/threonine protein kinase, bacterial
MSAMPLDEGSVFAGFTVVRMLGSGGMGEVYLVDHPRLPRLEALKILPAEVSADPGFRERFNREADLVASLFHPHIVGVHDRGECDGQLWISMDYVEGTDCARLLSQHRAGLPRDQAIEIIAAVASALDYAHERRLLHRDVKPANILLGSGDTGRIMLADFGIARRDTSGLTATGAIVGTKTYAAPEQLISSDIDGRADQYALAATAYQLFCGEPPFDDPNPAALIGHHLTSTPPSLGAARPELADLDAAMSRALAKQRDARFASCQDFAAALRAGAQALPEDIATSAVDTGVAPAEPTVVEPAQPTVTAPIPTVVEPIGPPAPTAPATIAPVMAPMPEPVAPSTASTPSTKSARKRRMLVLIPIIVVLVAIAVVTAVLLMRHSAPTVSQEDRVRTTIRNFDTAVQKGDLATLRSITCGATRDGYLQYNDEAWATTYRRTQIAKQYPVIDTIDEVAVNGQHAEANVTTYMAYDPQVRSTRSLDLQLLDGEWKICQSPGR